MQADEWQDIISIYLDEEGDAVKVDFMYKGVLMITVLALIGWLGKYLYLVDGEIDWFRLMLVYGVPVEIPYMFFIIPWHWDLSGILGMMTLCVIVGSLFGSFIAIWLLVRAVGYVIGYPINYMIKSIKGKN